MAALALVLHDFRLTVRVEIENEIYPSMAEAIGRTARALTRVLPPSVDDFKIGLLRNGLAGSEMTIRRSDLKELEYAFENAWRSFSRARFWTVVSLSPRGGSSRI